MRGSSQFLRNVPSGSSTRRESEPSCYVLYFKMFLAVFTMLLGVILAICINVFDSRDTNHTTAIGATTIRTQTIHSQATKKIKTDPPPVRYDRYDPRNPPDSPSDTYYFVVMNNEPQYRNKMCLDHKDTSFTGDMDQDELFVSNCTWVQTKQFVYKEGSNLVQKGYDSHCVIAQLSEDPDITPSLALIVKCSPEYAQNFPIDSYPLLYESKNKLCLEGRATAGKIYAVSCKNPTDYSPKKSNGDYLWWQRIPIENPPSL